LEWKIVNIRNSIHDLYLKLLYKIEFFFYFICVFLIFTVTTLNVWLISNYNLGVCVRHFIIRHAGNIVIFQLPATQRRWRRYLVFRNRGRGLFAFRGEVGMLCVIHGPDFWLNRVCLPPTCAWNNITDRDRAL